MERVIQTAKELILGMCVIAIMIAVYFGAVLQESYKLSPVTAEEITTAERVDAGNGF